ncbi:hypothetical protein TRFO_12125 [Tritrichomonas foetus]|uniref:Uncharacterized protein n=1 Tax=Tritrichomonas foetus TaxID=1144522 RepID=A0A1J4J6Y4_9EUKA|nr:hypothetical protein TRFO_12125 [Tritrichomonas foetus]|eukprot:OHS92948.1 hypothetical protein TRFO_12125 [Tritrichomonas foetus]
MIYIFHLMINFDPVFVDLYNAQAGFTQLSPHEMLVLMAKFRHSLSFKWIQSIPENTQEVLKVVIITLLHLTEERNTGIRLAAYSTIGTLILTVAPYSPSTFINAFGDAITSLPVSPKISIAIINTFMCLMKFVSPVRIQSFVENMPILHHFGADISDFIQYLPKTMPMMKKLPPEFQQSILKSLVTACGREPNGHFAASISGLIHHNRELLIPDLQKYLIRNKFSIAAIWIGPILFSDKKNYEIMDDEGKEFFLSNSFAQLKENPLNLSLFEYSCRIIAFAMRYSKSKDELIALKDRFKGNLLDNYQLQYRTALMAIPCDNINLLIDNPEEPESVRAVRLSAISNYFFDHIETVDADQIAKIMYDLHNTHNDLYSSLIDNFSKCINLMFTKCKEQHHIDLLKFIFSKKNSNWVQDVKVVQLIRNINVDLCRRNIPEYPKIVINLLLEHTISPTDTLFEEAVEALKKFASYETIVEILVGVKDSDWISENIVYKRFYLLHQLARLFKVHYFSYFVGIAYECLFFCDSLKTHSVIFAFLSHTKVTYLPDNVKQFSFNFIEKYYYMYSHCPIDDKSDVETLSTDFMDYDADIVTNPLIDHKNALSHLKNCYAFLCSLPQNLLNDKERLYRYSIAFVTIFDKYALEMAAKLAVGHKKSEEFVWNLSIDTFKTTSDDDVAASCCNIFVNDQRILPPFIETMLEQFIGEKCTANPELLFLCLLNVDQANHEKVVAAVPTVLSWLSVQNGIVLLFKLIQIVGRDIIPSIRDEYGLALLQYANEFQGKYAESVRNYLKLTDFADVPLEEPTLNENLLVFMENEPMIRLKNPDKIDLNHWMFIFDHVYLFDLSDLSDYIDTHRSVFAKVKAESLAKSYVRNFSLKKVTNVSKFPSTSPLLSLNTFIEEPALIKSFAIFRNQSISQTLFNDMVKCTVESQNVSTLTELLRFAILTNQKVQITIEDDIFFHDELIRFTALLNPSIVMKKLNIKKDPSLIVDQSLNEHVRLAFISRDPDYYIQYLTNYPKFKKKHFLIMIKMLMTVHFSIEKLSDLIVKYISVYKSMESDHKKQVFVRFLSASLHCLKRKKQTTEYKSFINFLSFHFSNIATDSDSALLQEFSYLFAHLSIYSTESAFFIDFLNTILSIASAPPMYMISTTYMISKKAIPVTSIDDSMFQLIMEYELPSFTSSVMKSLTYIGVGKDIHLDISGKFEIFNFKYNFKTVHYTCQFVKFYEDLIGRFVEIFLSNSSLACFNDCLGLASKSPEVIDRIFNADYCSIEVIMTLSEVLNRKSSLYFEKNINFFLKFPRIETWELVEKVSKVKPSITLKLLFIRLPTIIDQFIVLYCNLRRYYIRADKQTKIEIQELIENSADLFSIQSRFFALMMIWEQDLRTTNLGFIVAANESNQFHSIATEFDMRCSKS